MRAAAFAIRCFAFRQRAAILDTNVARVLFRVFVGKGDPKAHATVKQLWTLSEALVPRKHVFDFNQALMDFGATLCTRHDPACMLCVLQDDCVALREGRVEELPTSKPGKPLPERTAIILLAENEQGQILLQRRPPVGIWASLWSLPEAVDHEAARDWFQRHLDGDYDHGEALPEVPHVFSHYKLRMHPLRWPALAARDVVRDNDDLRWVDRAGLKSLGLPAPIRKLLES